MEDWPHQVRAVAEARKAFDAGLRRICITSPTGGGKLRIAQRIIEWGLPTVFYVNRNLLLEQTAERFSEFDFGIQAAGYLPIHGDRLQIASIQTVDKRWRAGRMDLHDAKLVLIDEWHNEKSERAKRIMDEHEKAGATVIGFTATPVGLGGVAENMIVAGCNSELRACGALVPAQTFAPDEPDHRAFKGKTKGLLQFKDEYREVMLPVIFGRVIEHYQKINPDHRPTVLFAPGVEESRWFAEQFNANGLPWSHIDGERMVINGLHMPSTPDNRKSLRDALVSGETLGVCNRFVLREGIDIPPVSHCIFACTFGSLVSYLQSGGRVLRAFEGKEYATIADHGGNFWRWDSLNADREWSLDDTDQSVQQKIADNYREKKEPEPIVCPKCTKVRTEGSVCPFCGFQHASRKRIVIQTNGTLREVHGDIHKPRVVDNSDPAEKSWVSCYWRCRNSGKTFAQAIGLYRHLNRGKYPSDEFIMMPTSKAQLGMKISEVPMNQIVQTPKTPYTSKPEQPTLFK